MRLDENTRNMNQARDSSPTQPILIAPTTRATAGCLILMALLLAGQVAMAATDDLRAEVGRLVQQLDAPQLAARETAEAALLRHGPAVLELLPPERELRSAEVRQRVGRVRQRLEQIAADAVVNPSLITLHAQSMPLSQILAALDQQSGNKIVDYRRQFGQPASDPTLAIDFDKTPFWPALDRLLDRANLTLYPYAPQGLGVVAAMGATRRADAARVSYSGPFRFEAVSVRSHRDLTRLDDRALVVGVDAIWEPRLHVVTLFQRMADIHAVDDRGERLAVYDESVQKETPVGANVAGDPGKQHAAGTRLDVMLRLPPRDVKQIASLKGKLTATVLGKTETFCFKLADAKKPQQRIAGVTVAVEEVRRDDGACVIGMKVRFDDAGDALASHRQWIFSNDARLENADGTSIAYDSFETTAQAKNEVGLAYRFKTDRPFDALTFVYNTPGTIVRRDFEYELKGIELP